MIGRGMGLSASRRKLLIAGLAFWAVFSAFLAFPSFNSSRSNERDIAELESRISDLGRWSGTRASPDSSVALWQDSLDERFDRLFPRKKSVEQLLYQLARSANGCGIDPLHVQLKEKIEKRGRSQREPGRDDSETALDERLMAQLAMGPRQFPGSELQVNVLQLQFEADFASLTKYLDEIRRMPRALNVNALHLNEGPDRIKVDVELEYYVQSPR